MEMTVLQCCVLLVLLTTTCAIVTQANHANHAKDSNPAILDNLMKPAEHTNPATRAKPSDSIQHAKPTNRAARVNRAHHPDQVVHSPVRTALLIDQVAERQVVAQQPIGEEVLLEIGSITNST